MSGVILVLLFYGYDGPTITSQPVANMEACVALGEQFKREIKHLYRGDKQDYWCLNN